MEKIEHGAELIKDRYFGNLDKAIEILAIERYYGRNTCIEFNGKILYAQFDNADTCYQKVTGFNSKAEFDKKVEEDRLKWEEEQRKEKEEALSKRDEYIRRGEALVSADKKDEWTRCVDIRISDIYNGKELENALQVMEELETNKANSMEKANKILESANHSGASYGITMSIIKTFSKHGEEFVNYVKNIEVKQN